MHVVLRILLPCSVGMWLRGLAGELGLKLKHHDVDSLMSHGISLCCTCITYVHTYIRTHELPKSCVYNTMHKLSYRTVQKVLFCSRPD